MDYKWYKGTKQQCLDYDTHVSKSENYRKGGNWANTEEINGDFYILKHPDYESEMQLVSELPKNDIKIDNELE